MLERAGLIDIEKGYEGRRPRTWITLTKTGGAALRDELAALKALIRTLEGGLLAAVEPEHGDHEVDLIVTRDDGRMVALEVKLAPVAGDGDVRHLQRLREQVGDNLLEAAVITTGPAAYRRPDGIAVIPAALLGP